MGKNARYERLKQSGICTQCGKKPAETGRLLCAECREYKNFMSKKYRMDNRKMMVIKKEKFEPCILRKHCKFWSTPTQSCDYIIWMGESRALQCGIGRECTVFMAIDEKSRLQAERIRNNPDYGIQERENGQFKSWTETHHDMMLELYESGMTDTQIAEEILHSKTTVQEWRKRHNLPPNTGKPKTGGDAI